MRVVKKYLFKLYSYLVIYGQILKCRIKRRPEQTKESVLIIAAGGIGDAIISAQAYKALLGYFTAKHLEVYLITDMAMGTGLKMLLQPGDSVHWITSAFLNGPLDEIRLDSYRRLVKELWPLNVDRAIITSNIQQQYRRACYVASCLQPQTVNAGLYDQYPRRFEERIRLFAIESLFYRAEELPRGLNEAVFWRCFINTIGVFNYKISISYIEKQCDFHWRGEYLVISVDSSDVIRRWPPENFIELIERLLEQQKYDIVLTGRNVSEAIRGLFKKAFQDCVRVKIMIGELKTAEWVELVRGSQLVIGVDSGIIHLAAAVRTQAICIAGEWDGCRFYPYVLEERTDLLEPRCVFRSNKDVNELPCVNCASRGKKGYDNRECKKLIKAGKPYLCLSKVSPEDVLKAICETNVLRS